MHPGNGDALPFISDALAQALHLGSVPFVERGLEVGGPSFTKQSAERYACVGEGAGGADSAGFRYPF